MTARKEEGRWAWRLTGFVTLCVYIFMFAPILATVILSFNASMFGGFPMTGFSLQWYAKLMNNDAVLSAFRTSLWIALVTAAITTAIGVVTAFALVRFEFPGKQALSTLVILPALVPETILGVGLLVLIKAADQPRTMLLLVLGHIMLAVPYVVLIAQALAGETPILLLDEPAAALDLHHQDEVIALIRSIADSRRLAVLFTTHHPDHAFAISDKVLLMHDDERHLIGPTVEIMTEAHLAELYKVPVRLLRFTAEGRELTAFAPIFRSQVARGGKPIPGDRHAE